MSMMITGTECSEPFYFRKWFDNENLHLNVDGWAKVVNRWNLVAPNLSSGKDEKSLRNSFQSPGLAFPKSEQSPICLRSIYPKYRAAWIVVFRAPYNGSYYFVTCIWMDTGG